MQNGILSQFQAQRLSRLHKAHVPGLYTFDTTPKRNAMKKVISVRFKDNGKTYTEIYKKVREVFGYDDMPTPVIEKK